MSTSSRRGQCGIPATSRARTVQSNTPDPESPGGVVPLIEDFLWQHTPGETADYHFDQRLDEYQGQKVRIVFRQWFDGYPGDDTQTRIRDLTFTPLNS